MQGRRIIVLAALLTVPGVARTQGVGIEGNVVDPQGKAVVGAVVRLTSKEGNNVQQTVTGNEGQFSFNGIAAGTYLLKVAVKGFETASQSAVVDDVHVLSISIRLKIIPKQQTVSVTAHQTL